MRGLKYSDLTGTKLGIWKSGPALTRGDHT